MPPTDPKKDAPSVADANAADAKPAPEAAAAPAAPPADPADAPVAAFHPVPAAAPAEPAAEAAADPADEAPQIPHGVAVMRHPDDRKAGASFGGQSFEPDDKGFLVVPLGAVEPLKSHGFELIKEG